MNILLATDGSEFSEVAAHFLTRFDLSSRDQVIIFHIVSEVPYEDEYHAQIKRVIKRVAPQILSAASDILKGIKAKVSVVEHEGAPDTGIVEYAADSGIDCIVMGARGIKGLKKLFLGSVTRAVVNNAVKPVLVVKRTEWETPRKMRMLFATDGSESAIGTAKLITVFPCYDDFEVTVLNIQRPEFYTIPERFAIEVEDRIKVMVADRRTEEIAASEKILNEAQSYLGQKFRHVETITKFGDPSYEILSTAEQMKADIIAIGSRGLKGIRSMLGSVSRNVVINAKSSVLIGKAG